ncbi:MAG: UDP-N-acetylglucosamine--N-acetylmuramyl-(pentapeptide) pyrophosphoryl-undecaprenol N-acetylglucosamine transferase [Synergistaceae bacterium]|jgi:UDP-N-acetylglucosamine--N-acetylmuramyl-(pentapeptide) pyrophosphoryl-undecaprenol N-acetylglucosamine transferase|nr:UDP-N-acetylglucosamine--N-acetylmuramyl-(pentapeptide) pyrophosphoryl-undecaprenol N-acetylglucosamine transferase [Synergistaceae bacterium]
MAGTVLIVAGGTGGHIFPALAFGQWLRSQKKAERVAYISGNRALEAEIYASQGIVPECLPLSGSPLGTSSVLQVVRRSSSLFGAFFRTGKIMRRLRPDLCFLFGGYVSLMPLLWCRLLRIPAVMHEPNACAGKVTRLASRLGVSVAAGWNECRGLSAPFVTTGIPVRRVKKMERRDAARALNADAGEDLVIGVIGGSLSSASLNALPGKLMEALRSGTTDGKERRPAFVVLGDPPGVAVPSIHFVGRRWDTAPFYSLIDAAVCRAGASTLAELALYGIPALVVPWSDSADGHQEANARCFAAMTGNPVWVEKKTKDAAGLDDAFTRLLALCLSPDRPRASGFAPHLNAEAASQNLWQIGLKLCPERFPPLV